MLEKGESVPTVTHINLIFQKINKKILTGSPVLLVKTIFLICTTSNKLMIDKPSKFWCFLTIYDLSKSPDSLSNIGCQKYFI